MFAETNDFFLGPIQHQYQHIHVHVLHIQKCTSNSWKGKQNNSEIGYDLNIFIILNLQYVCISKKNQISLCYKKLLFPIDIFFYQFTLV